MAMARSAGQKEQARQVGKGQAASRAQEGEIQYRTLFESAGEALLLLRGDLIVDCNRRAEQVLGGGREQILDQPLSRFIPLSQPDGRGSGELIAEWLRTAAEDRHALIDVRHSRLDGALFEAEVALSCARISGEPHLLVSIRDVTGKRRCEERLRQEQKMEALSRMAGKLAHDLNNILSVISGYCDLSLSQVHDESLAENLAEIRNANARAGTLTRQLQTFSRKQSSQPRLLDLNGVIGGAETLLHDLLGDAIQLTTILDPALWQIKADSTQIEQILVNLTTNARNAMPHGGTLTIETRNAAPDPNLAGLQAGAPAGPAVQLVVTDNGTGMSAEVLSHVFEPFFTTRRKGQSKGLGLAVVYGTVRQYGGWIRARSEPGHGASFEILFPRAE